MNPPNRLPAGVLATVLVVSALMLLSVLGVLALWESDFLFFSRAGYLSRQRANVESAFVLYAADSTLTARLDEQGGLRLYDGLPDSRVRIAVRPWGLYEAVRVEAADPRIAPTRLFGSAAPFACLPGEESGLWYATDAASLSLAGRTSLHGCLRLPRHGVQYGQIRSVFFCGERIEGARTAYAGKELPPVRTDARRMTDSLLRLLEAPGAWIPAPDSLSAGFGEAEPRMLDAGSFGPGTRVEGMAVLFEEIIVFYPYRVSFARIARELERGACLSEALERFAELYDRRLVTLLRVGEQTGRLPEMLAREGDVLTGELEHRLRSLGNLLEPVLILLVGLLVAAVIVWSTWGLLRDSLRLSLDGVPAGIDYDEVFRTVASQPGVSGVHHLHVWALSTTENALTAHVAVHDLQRMPQLKEALRARLRELGIDHATLEFESDVQPCGEHADCDMEQGRCGGASQPVR